VSSFARTPEEIHKSFEALRPSCLDEGLELLDSLERLTIMDNWIIAMHERLIELELESTPDPPALRLVDA
jgi:hypothetical protein